jgi:putative ABC transport system permease protein
MAVHRSADNHLNQMTQEIMTDASPQLVQENKGSLPRRRFAGLFGLRLIVLSLALLALMIFFNINIGSIGQGLAYALVGVAVYMTFRVLHFPDLTVDGSFPIGGAVCAALIVAGVQAEYTLPLAFAAGALVGLVTALITVSLRIEGLLASIIVITGAYTITLRTLDSRSNLALIGERTILTPYQMPVRTWLVDTFGDEMRRQSNNLVEILVFLVVVVLVLLLLNWFMHTELGLMVRAAGQNDQMVRALGINHHYMIILALVVSNGLVGLSGALTVQLLGFADVSLGFGVIVRGLAAVRSVRSTIAPRPMLMRNAPVFICRNCSRRKSFSVSGVCGAAMATKSLSASSFGSCSGFQIASTPSGVRVRTASTASTLMPKAEPRRAISEPM